MQYVPDWFMTQQQLRQFYDDDEYDDEFFKWYKVKWHEDYQKRKTQKAKIKDELMLIVWHPSRW